MEIHLKHFSDLSKNELYDLLELRCEIFVVEQNCVYQDIDGKDQKALHVLGKKEGKIIAYARCFSSGLYFEEAAIGRVLVKESERKNGYADQILSASIRAIKNDFDTLNIKLSAQQYLVKFYQKHGFQIIGEGYLEDGIPHIAMIRQ